MSDTRVVLYDDGIHVIKASILDSRLYVYKNNEYRGCLYVLDLKEVRALLGPNAEDAVKIEGPPPAIMVPSRKGG